MKDNAFIFISSGVAFFAFSDQQAAIGAALGSAFFLSTKYEGGILNRLILTIVSFGAGYGAGLSVTGGHTMLVAMFGAGVGSAILGASHKAVIVARDAIGRAGVDLAPWVKTLIEIVLRIRK